ncbi:MAG TPA: NADH-quinone oxidoreductase subunit NuoF [Chloroflexi bacterium]|nr:NADH-quinone oxidoreductase subunit NuoF [Chloroflexota bacterium]
MDANSEVDLSQLDPVLDRYRDGGRTSLLPALHEAQRIYGYLPDPVLTAIGQALRVPLADIHGVVEFYTMFYDRLTGERIVRICTDPACALAGGEQVLEAACRHAGNIRPGETSPDGAVTVERATCIGLCDQAPAALVNEQAFAGLTPDDVEALLAGQGNAPEVRITGEPRVLSRRVGKISPTDLEAHRTGGAFEGLKHALTGMTPEEVIEEVKRSGLVGRGGAAFPTGLKWQFTRGAEGQPKYVVCNADESEPGTFKDRVLMEGDPFRVLEGMTICGYAIGSSKGYLFIRGEYPHAAAVLEEAVAAARQANLLGENILGTDFSFEIEIRRGAGAYICGEETALFEAIEGKRGYPRLKPPFPTTHGLFNRPTVINNVETLASVPDILTNGAEWFQQWGTEHSTGLKLFCVSGHVGQPSLVEAPFGITLRELIERYCGGFDGTPQAVLMGGAAGAFLTPDQFDTPLTFEDLRPLGASIGSGAIMVFNESVDLREVLRTLGHFFAHESCGKCYPCQLGTQRQMEILDRVAEGQAQAGDIERLTLIGQTMTDASICGLGQTAGMAVMSALRLWPDLFAPNGKGSA